MCYRAGMSKAEITFYGVRGSVAAAGKHTQRYGGNTVCLSIRYGKNHIICDAGTGIRPLGDKLLKSRKKIKATILLSHLHWDHFMGLPFFEPLYHKRNEFTIAGMGHSGKSFKTVFTGAMSPPYFPIKPSEFSAKVNYKTLTGKPFRIDDVSVQTFPCNHPGGSFGWKFIFPNGKTLIHISDNEPDPRKRDKQIEWMEGADLIIHDAQFSPSEYKQHHGWGHSPFNYPVEMAIAANAKRLYMYHYDPPCTDRELEKRLRSARGLVRRHRSNLRVDLSREGKSITL